MEPRAAALAVYLVLPGIAALLLGAALVALGVAAAWSRALLRAGTSVRVLELGGAGAVFGLTNGASLSAPVASRRYVSRYLVALPLGRPLSRTLLVTADMLGPQELRRLRLWALWGRLPGEMRGVTVEQLPA